MAAGTRTETKTLDRIIAVAAAQPGIGAPRVSQGYKRWSDTDDFNQLVRGLVDETQGYFWAALKTVASQGENQFAEISMAAELVVAVNKDASSDLNAAWEFALSLRDALQDPSNYADGEFWPRITIGLRGVDAIEGGGIAVFDFGGGDAGGSMEIADP